MLTWRTMRLNKQLACYGALVFILSLVPYLQTWHHDFINLDDMHYVVQCPQVRTGLTTEGVAWAFSSVSYGAIWMPLTWLSYMLDVSLWGVHPGAMHLHNALLHAGNALLLFMLLVSVFETRLGGASRDEGNVFAAAAVGALVWSLHPLRVEPVAWVASRKDVLSLFWELLALICWILGLRRSGWFWAAVFCFTFAALAKPTAMTFPVLACVLEVYCTGRMNIQRFKVPMLLAIASGLMATYSQQSGGATIALAEVPLIYRLINATTALGDYFHKTIWPTRLMVPYTHPWPNLPRFFVPGLAICAATAIIGLWCAVRCGLSAACRHIVSYSTGSKTTDAVSAASRTVARIPLTELARAVCAGLAFFFVAVAPMLGLANFGYHSHADRFTYLPAIGFSLIIASTWLLIEHATLGRCRKLLHIAGCSFALATLGSLAMRQVARWRNDYTLFSHALAIDPDNHTANRNLGLYFLQRRELKRATDYFEAALQANRKLNRDIQLYYIVALAESGQLDRARAETRELSEYKEREVLQAVERGEAFGPKGESTRLLDTFQAYAVIAYESGDFDMAREHAETVLRYNPLDAYAHYVLGQLELDAGRPTEAIKHWRISVNSGLLTLGPYLRTRIAHLRMGKQ